MADGLSTKQSSKGDMIMDTDSKNVEGKTSGGDTSLQQANEMEEIIDLVEPASEDDEQSEAIVTPKEEAGLEEQPEDFIDLTDLVEDQDSQADDMELSEVTLAAEEHVAAEAPSQASDEALESAVLKGLTDERIEAVITRVAKEAIEKKADRILLEVAEAAIAKEIEKIKQVL